MLLTTSTRKSRNSCHLGRMLLTRKTLKARLTVSRLTLIRIATTSTTTHRLKYPHCSLFREDLRDNLPHKEDPRPRLLTHRRCNSAGNRSDYGVGQGDVVPSRTCGRVMGTADSPPASSPYSAKRSDRLAIAPLAHRDAALHAYDAPIDIAARMHICTSTWSHPM